MCSAKFNASLGLELKGKALDWKVKLKNGLEMPRIAIGTYLTSGQPCSDAVEAALRAGYRHIDTARLYQNEKGVRKGIDASGVPRSEIFITSKIPPWQQGFHEANEALEAILSGLGTDYIDLLLIHFPGCGGELSCPRRRLDTWKAMEFAVTAGKVKALGVSNFEASHIAALMTSEQKIHPMVLQSEFHPFNYKPDLLTYLAEHDIIFEAYGSMNAQGLLDHQAVTTIANELKKTNAQVLLRWALQHGCVILPKSTKPKRILENSQLDDFVLTKEHMVALNSLNQGEASYWSGKGVA